MQVYPVFLPLAGCPFRCIYCDQFAITGENCYNLDIHLEDIANFCKKFQDEDKEIAFFGGTFSAFDLEWQKTQFQKLKAFLNDKTHIRYSTRPDCLSQEDLDLAKEYNVGTIELGIQSFSDKVLKASARGYSQKQAIQACNLILENNIKLGIQLMPGLPQYDTCTQQESLDITLHLHPSYVRIYPTVVFTNTGLEKLYKRDEYNPLSLTQAVEISAQLQAKFSQHNITVIKMGVQVDSESVQNIVCGPYHAAFGELVKSYQLVELLAKLVNQHEQVISITYSHKIASLLTGHKSYGKRLLASRINLEKIKLNIDNKVKKSIIILNTNKESVEYEI
jgi:histone acetyltransferase (RNA polymerase elongator complex component)